MSASNLTKELTEAAKAFGRYDETHEQFAMVRDFDSPKPHYNAISILLAALEAAEERIKELEEEVEDASHEIRNAQERGDT